MTKVSNISATKEGLQLVGDLVFSSVSELLKEGRFLLEAYQKDKVSINCSKVSRIDSAGIALLIEWKRWCYNHNKECQLVEVPEQAQSLIETYRLQKVL